MADELSRCVHCDSYINPGLGAGWPTEDTRNGTQDDPRAPGDWDNICDYCNYAVGLRGGPSEP